MIKIEKRADLLRIENESHRAEVREYLEDILEPLYEETTPEELGYLIYLEPSDELFASNDELYFDAAAEGILFKLFLDTPCWESVSEKDSGYLILMLMNNEFGITYYISKELAGRYPVLLKHLEEEKSCWS